MESCNERCFPKAAREMQTLVRARMRSKKSEPVSESSGSPKTIATRIGVSEREIGVASCDVVFFNAAVQLELGA